MEMDVLEEVEIEENQIGFDFLEKENLDTEVEQAESFDWVADETLVLIVRSNEFIAPNFQLCGRALTDWVSFATSSCKQIFLENLSEENLLDSIRDYAENYKFVAVLYSDTPLLQRQTFFDVMSYFSKNRMNFMKLSRGYVFKAEFLKSARVLLSSSIEDFGETDFLILDSAEKISFAYNVLNGRILGYHKANGVVLLGENTTFIDADVEIEAGVVVYPNNVLKGESYIGKNVILESGNYIIDTIICDGAFVCQSYLDKSKVETNKIVGPFAKLINQKI